MSWARPDFPRLVSDFFEMFTETPVFAGLEYGELIDKCEARLAIAPDDYRARLELARVLSKCGRYEDADREFKMIPPTGEPVRDGNARSGGRALSRGRYVRARSGRKSTPSSRSVGRTRARPCCFLLPTNWADIRPWCRKASG